MARARSTHGFGRWAAICTAILISVFGIPIFGGGVWLAALGGSWYYVFAGVGLLVTAYFLFRQSLLAVWIYLLTFGFTVAWALWESGFDRWAQVPRLVAPTVILLLILALIPWLRSPHGRIPGVVAAAAAGLIAIVGSAYVFHVAGTGTAIAQGDQPNTSGEVRPSAPVDDGATNMPPPDQVGSETSSQPPNDQVEAGPDAQANDTADHGRRSPTGVAVGEARQMPTAGTDWVAYGGDNHATRYSSLSQITPENVGDLELVWEFRTGDMPQDDERFSNQNTPLKIGDRVLICSAMNKVISLDAATGLEEWRYDPAVPTDAIPYNATCRGLAYYQAPQLEPTDLCNERVIMNTLDARLIALDVATGQLCSDFGNSGIVDLEVGLGRTAPGWYAPTSPPTIVRNIAVVHSQVRDGQRRDAPSGVVRGYDALTGELAWAWDHARPDIDGLPPEGETYTRGTSNVWTISSADEELGHVYLPHGVPSVDYWGGMRSDLENEYSTALVALDVTTGKPAWHYQTVNYDIWDYDLGAQGANSEGSRPPIPR